MIVFFVLTQVAKTMTLGIVITTIPIGLGLLLSLGLNGGIHFKARPLKRVEVVFLGIEAALLLLFVIAGAVDQYLYDQIVFTSMGSSFGHWLDWFMPLWLLLGPVTIVVFILGLVNRSSAASSSAR